MGTDPSAALMANSPAVLLPNTSSYSWEEWQQIFDAVDHNEAK